MYTQCSKCETIFRLSADVLRAAGGQVRCGRCGEVFNALARLAEDPSTFPAGESHFEMETRANDILESAVPPLEQQGETSAASLDIIEIEDIDTSDVEFARLQVVEKFVESSPPPSAGPSTDVKAAPILPRPAPPSPATKPAAAAPPIAPKPKPMPPPAASPTPPAASPAAPSAAPRTAPPAARAAGTSAGVPSRAPPPSKAPASPPPPTASSPRKAPTTASAQPAPPAIEGKILDDGSMEFTLPPGELDRVFVERAARQPPGTAASPPAAAEKPAEADAAPGLEVSERVRREMLSEISEPALPDISAAPRRSVPSKVWVVAAILLTLLLCAQWAHGNRQWLATHAPLRGPLRGLYAAFGVAVAVPANLSAYQLRQWGVTGDPSASGALRVRASILNIAAQLQPYPLLRVTLANRFGTKLGTRDFEPAEYMGKPIVRMLAPGERADATLDIVDPGKDAEGFEIDVCIRGADQKVTCAGDAAAQTKQPHGGN